MAPPEPASDPNPVSRTRGSMRTAAAGLAAVTLAAAFLLLWRLDTPLLWQDEAETANVAVNLLETGYPTPWDGTHLVTQQAGRDAVRLGGPSEPPLWAWHPWPQHLLTAVGLAVAGDLVGPTAAARLPFALLALASVPLVWAWRRSRCPAAEAVVATAIYGLSLPFVLYSRQCRYYALLFLGGMLVFWIYQRLGDRAPAGRIALENATGLGAALALVFYANPLTGLALGAGLGAHALLCARERLRPLMAAGVLFTLLAAPWLALVMVSEVRAPERSLGTWVLLLVSQLWRAQYTLLPAVLWPVLGWIWWRRRGRQGGDEIALLGITGAVLTVLVSLEAPIGTARYLLPLWPLCAAVLAGLWRLLHERSRFLGAAFLVVLLGTDLLPSLPAAPVTLVRSEGPGVDAAYDREAPPLDKLAHNGRVGAPLLRFLAEQADPSCGPVAALVALAKGLERPPRAVAAGYAWESLHFYLGVPAVGPGLQGAARRRLGLPSLDPARIDLVVPRRGWPRPQLPPSQEPRFVAVDLGIPDDAYENLPDPTGARFGPSDLPPLTVFVREELIPPRWPPPDPNLPCSPPEPRIVGPGSPNTPGRPEAAPAR